MNEPIVVYVDSGETLSEIATRHGVTVEQLQQWNRIEDPDYVQVGQRIIVQEAVVAEEAEEAVGAWGAWIGGALVLALLLFLFRRKRDAPTSASETRVALPSGASHEHDPKPAKSVPARKVRIPRTSRARWIPANSTVTIARREVGGMIYVGPQPLSTSWGPGGGPFIDPGLRVAKVGSDLAGDGMPYWPNYTDISPQARATYLDWLAGSRSERQISPGYVFLYFYGLERRFFVDNPAEDEKQELIEEAERLLRVYGENHSVKHYLGAFLDAAQVVVNPAGNTEPRFERSSFELPLVLRVTIGRKAKQKLPLDADWLLAWLTNHAETRLRTPARRAFPEFRELFKILFDERLPSGLKLRTPKRLLRPRYAAASGAFEVDLTHYVEEIPDISGTSKPLAIARDIAEEAMNSLDKYSRFLGRKPEGRGTIEAHALLPQPLWPLFPCAEMEDLRHWAEEVITNGGLSPVEKVIEQLEGDSPKEIGKRQLTGAADALARMSIGMAPDPRFALRSPRLGEPVVLFALPQGIKALEDVSEKFKNLLVTIAIGSFVAHADGTFAARERRVLERRIDRSNVSAAEHARLNANLQWMLAVPPDVALFRHRLRQYPENIRQNFGKVALTMAVADGTIDSGEIRAIERLYKAVGLPIDSVYSDLLALAAGERPVTVRAADEQADGFAIPPSPKRDTKVVLDPGRVAKLMADTARVSTVLGEIFSNDDPEEDSEIIQDQVDSGFEGLDAQHAAFLGALLARPQWNEVEFTTLAGQFRLMHAGALETLNEWCFERFGDVLVEEYEGYELNPDIVSQLENEGTMHASLTN